MSYGASDSAAYRRAGSHYVPRNLKGAKPGDLPVEIATKYELAMLFAAALAQPTNEPSDHERGQQERDDHAHADEHIGDNDSGAVLDGHGARKRSASMPRAQCPQFHHQPGSSVSISRAAASTERVTLGGTERNVLLNSLSSSGEPLGAVSTWRRSFLRSTFRIRRGPTVPNCTPSCLASH